MLHAAWGRGATFPFHDRDGLNDAVIGRRTTPSPAACFAVAGALIAATALVADVPHLPRGLQRLGVTGVATVLATRAGARVCRSHRPGVARQFVDPLPPPRPARLLTAVRRARRGRDELAPGVTVDALGWPTTADDVTPEWLTAALAERHPGTEVDSVEVVERNEVTNAHARLRVTYARTGDALDVAPDAMFCKLPPNDDRRQQIIATGMGHREARFYAQLAPSVAMRVPAAHVARTDDDGHFALLLEDLVTTGCDVSDGTWGIPVDSAAGAIEDLAALHVRFDDPARRAAEAPWVHVSRPTSDYAAGMLREGIDHHRDRLTDSFVDIAEIYIAHHDELQRLWHEGPHTVIHGDTHIGNLFLDEGRVGFLDWGIINVNTPMRDISYLLTMAMSIDDRRAHERDLLRFYLELRRGPASPRSRSTRPGAPIASTPRTTSPRPARWCASPRTSRRHDGCSPITSSNERRPRSTTSRRALPCARPPGSDVAVPRAARRVGRRRPPVVRPMGDVRMRDSAAAAQYVPGLIEQGATEAGPAAGAGASADLEPGTRAPTDTAASSIATARSRFLLWVACCVVAVGVLITVVDEVRSPTTAENMHVVQAQAFLDGRLEIPKDLADVAVYRGEGFSPFPPGPVLVVLPFVAVLGERVEIAILVGLALWLLSAWFVRRICLSVGVSGASANLLAAGAVLGTGAWMAATSSSGVWYLSLIVAFTALLGAAGPGAARARPGRRRPVGARVPLAPAHHLPRHLCSSSCSRRDHANVRSRGARLLLVAIPLVLAVVVYCVYNDARFSGPLDTGYDYIRESDLFLSKRVEHHGLFSLAYVPFNFTYLFVQGFHVQYEGVEHLKTAASDPFGTSLTFASPFLFYAVLARPRRLVLWVAAAGLAVCVVAQLAYYNNGWYQINAQRFSLDFIPVLVLLLAYAMQRARSRLWIAAIGYAVALNFVALVVYDRLGWLDRLVGAT